MKTSGTSKHTITRIICCVAFFAAFTPVTRAYFVLPPEGLDKMTTNATIICKARVVSSVVITNSAFQSLPGFEAQATKLEIISVLKGDFTGTGKSLVFQHYASSPQDRMGREYAPQHYELEVGQSYLIFATNAGSERESRQIRMSHTGKEDEGVMRTLDARPLSNLSVKEAHWLELGLLLNSESATNQLYAIHQLDAFSKSCGQEWGHTDDFKRDTVLKSLSPFLTNKNDEVAFATLKCLHASPDCSALITPYMDSLIEIANTGFTIPRRVTAIAAFSGAKFPAVKNALPRWLGDSSDDIRLAAISLLPNFPGDFSEKYLRAAATDPSPKVRAGVADAIGDGKIASLLPTLKKLLTDPVGLSNPAPPLSIEDLRSGSRVWGSNNSDVHTAAGNALLKFDIAQVSEILTANLNDEGFRPAYLCKLAENYTDPWLTDLVEVLEARRIRIVKEVDASGVEPKADYLRARMTLSGTYFRCWNILEKYLRELPAAAFADGKMDRCLNAMENAGNSGSREPTALYEIYRMKGLNNRAQKLRADCEKRFAAYNLGQFFDRVDAQYPAKKVISNR